MFVETLPFCNYVVDGKNSVKSGNPVKKEGIPVGCVVPDYQNKFEQVFSFGHQNISSRGGMSSDEQV